MTKRLLVSLLLFTGLLAGCDQKQAAISQAPNNLLKFTPRKGNLWVELKQNKGCQMGDLDVVETDLEASKGARLILSLEPIHPGDTGFKAQSLTIGPKKFLAGNQMARFNLDQFKGPTVAGLFLCKDSQRQGRCNNKAAFPMGNLASMLAFDLKPKEQKLLEKDKIYYFQPVIVDQGEISIFQAGKSEQEYYQTFRQAIIATNSEPHRKEMRRRTFKRLELLTKRLGSLGILTRSSAKGVELSMPFKKMDRGICRQEVAAQSYKLTPTRLSLARKLAPAKPLGVKFEPLKNR